MNGHIDGVIVRLQELHDLCKEHGKDINIAYKCYETGIDKYRTKQLKKLNLQSLYPSVMERNFDKYLQLMQDRYNTGVAYARDYILFNDTEVLK